MPLVSFRTSFTPPSTNRAIDSTGNQNSNKIYN